VGENEMSRSLDPDLSDVSDRGPVAQLGARFHGMEEVAGSIPARSTNFYLTVPSNKQRKLDLSGQ
jgi:hypothetical protein